MVSQKKALGVQPSFVAQVVDPISRRLQLAVICLNRLRDSTLGIFSAVVPKNALRFLSSRMEKQ